MQAEGATGFVAIGGSRLQDAAVTAFDERGAEKDRAVAYRLTISDAATSPRSPSLEVDPHPHNLDQTPTPNTHDVHTTPPTSHIPRTTTGLRSFVLSHRLTDAKPDEHW